MWNREAEKAGERHRVFCASLADVFEDRPELIDWRVELFELIDTTQQLDWLLLTKRPENVRRMWPDNRSRENVWLGTSVSDQATADVWTERLVGLRHLAPILFLSAEPLIGPVTIPHLDQIDWVIVGGESHRSAKIARHCDDEWIRGVIKQCDLSKVPVFVKQLGTRQELKDKKGGDMAEWPTDLRVREFPGQPVAF
jgi:protein gp37